MEEADRFSQQALISPGRPTIAGEAAALNVRGDLDVFSGRTRESLANYQVRWRSQRPCTTDEARHRRYSILATPTPTLPRFPTRRAYEAALGALARPRRSRRTSANLGWPGPIARRRWREPAGPRPLPGGDEAFELLGDRVGLAITLNGLAMVHFRLGDPATSVAYLQRAVDLFRAVKLRMARQGTSWTWAGV